MIAVKIRLFIYSLCIIILLAVQSTLLGYFEIWGVKPNLILVLVVCAALLNGELEGAVIGLIAGFSVDVFSGRVLGFNSLLLMYAGIGVGLANRHIYRENYLVVTAVTFLSTVIYESAVFLLRVFPGNEDITLLYPFSRIILPEAVYNCVVSIFIFAFMIKLNYKLENADLV